MEVYNNAADRKLPEKTAQPPRRVYSPVPTSVVAKEVTGKGRHFAWSAWRTWDWGWGSPEKQNLSIINEHSPIQGGDPPKCLLSEIPELLPLGDCCVSPIPPLSG